MSSIAGGKGDKSGNVGKNASVLSRAGLGQLPCDRDNAASLTDRMQPGCCALALSVADAHCAPSTQCSWGARMPWLPIRQDPRLVRYLVASGAVGGRSQLRRFAPVSALSLSRHLGASQAVAEERPRYNIELRAAFAAWGDWTKRSRGSVGRCGPASLLLPGKYPAMQQGEGLQQPRFTRCYGRYEVWSELHRTADSRVECAIDKGRARLAVVLKIFYPRAFQLASRQPDTH